MRNVYVSSNAFAEKSLDAIYRECVSRGIRYLEVGSGVPYDPYAVRKIVKMSAELNIILHNYIPAPKNAFVLNLASEDKEVIRKSLELVEHALKISSQIGASHYGVHAGFAYSAEPGALGKKQTHLAHIPLEEAKKIFLDTLYFLSERARNYGVKLLIENNVVPSFNLIEGTNKSYLLAGIEDSKEIFSQIASWGVGLLLDTGHLNVSAHALGFDRFGYIESMREHIVAFHVSDNDGTSDQHLPPSNSSWFLDVLHTFPEHLVTVEVEGKLNETIESISLIQ